MNAITLPKPHVVCDQVATQLFEALRGPGYAYIKSAAFPAPLLAEIKRAGKSMCSLSSSVRDRFQAPHGFRGYYQYVGASGASDHITCFSIGMEGTPDLVKELRSPYYTSRGWSDSEMKSILIDRVNQWPESADSAASRTVLTQYYSTCATELIPSLANHVTRAVQLAFPEVEKSTLWNGPSASRLASWHSRQDHNLECKLYPASMHTKRVALPVASKRLRGNLPSTAPTSLQAPPLKLAPVERLKTHRDLSTFTLLIQDAMGGLEVLDEGRGEFVPVPVLEDAVLINAGEFLSRWSGEMFPATPHRVRNCTSDASSRDRCSVVFFGFPDFDARIVPIGAGAAFVAGDMHPLP